jgi:hypothetical protein
MPPWVPNQHLFAGQLVGVPAHPGVLRHAEQVAAGRFHQHLRRQRQRALRTGCMGDDRIKRIILGVKIVSMVILFSGSAELELLQQGFELRFRLVQRRGGGSTYVEIGRPHSTIASLITFTNGVSS